MPQIEFKDAVIRVDPVGSGQNHISVEAKDPRLQIHRRTWETAYPFELIEAIARTKGPAWICDEIMRDEQPSYVQRHIEFDILKHVPAEWFAGKRVLDFGSGCGASTVVMARMLPGAEFVGIELREDYTHIARRRAEYYGLASASFLTSPDPGSLPPDVGSFDAVVMSAVWEHLLPDERGALLELLWARLRPGGMLFIYETPHRYWPIEAHTTGIPMLNYLPDGLALVVARRFSRRVSAHMTWADLLRKGIRGGTARDIMGRLRRAGHSAVLLEPAGEGIRDRIDLWYCMSSGLRQAGTKRALRACLKVVKAVSGATLVPYISLAILKE
ncbi:MAG TPA: class I SAM-dependent methyltransferase [Candidatus Krumholzibacteria bacterium]|nr:class I SAM-dependent methyltransferase [Candidatus Krumholzibacteria bacterium]